MFLPIWFFIVVVFAAPEVQGIMSGDPCAQPIEKEPTFSRCLGPRPNGSWKPATS